MEKADIRELLRASGFRFDKALGQNFIFDGNLLSAIAADAGAAAGETVVEIGTGAGTLTRALADAAERVVSFEVDERLKDILSLTLAGADNVTVVFRDVLKMTDAELSAVGGKALPKRLYKRYALDVTCHCTLLFVVLYHAPRRVYCVIM